MKGRVLCWEKGFCHLSDGKTVCHCEKRRIYIYIQYICMIYLNKMFAAVLPAWCPSGVRAVDPTLGLI